MRRRFTTSDGAVLSYVDEGEADGTPLLLLPGWSQSAAMFRHQVAHFSPTRRVVVPDWRGHGESPDAGHGFRVPRFAADLHELMAHAGIGRADVVGWSMGASVLWAHLDLFGSGTFDRLVFLDEPAAVARPPGLDDAAAADAGALFDLGTMAGIAAQIAGPEGEAARGTFLDGMVTRRIDPALRAFLLRENLRPRARDIAALFADHCAIDWSDVFARVDRPTLVIGGRVSHVAVRSQEWISRQVRGSRLTVFEEAEGGGHFPFIEAPERFNAVLQGFLDGGA